jgi:hypothetical protein
VYPYIATIEEMSKGTAISEAPLATDKAGAVKAVRLPFQKRCIPQGELSNINFSLYC